MSGSDPFPARLREFLSQDHIVALMVEATHRGRPAIEGIGEELLASFGAAVTPDPVKQRLGKMVRSIMERHGFTHDSYGHKTPDSPLFSKGSLYT